MIRVSSLLLCLLFTVVVHASFKVEKQRFSMAEFTTLGGQTIKQLEVGWEAYGTLNAAKDNVVLITHYFTGNSHAAGYYSDTDPQPGYWDAIIGPGKAIDTNKYYVVSVDSLANLGVGDPNVITTGPASLNPATGEHYGLTFPVVTIRDFVNVQQALLSSLGITKLHAVVGPSMGSMQAIDWALAYPDWVPRVISVIGTAQSDPWTTALLERWAIPIRLDPNWNNGNYYNATPPTEGLTYALMFITQDALTPEFFAQMGASKAVRHAPLEEAPLADINASHRIVQWLHQRAAARAAMFDANHLLYLVRACQLFIAGHTDDLRTSLKRLDAKTLWLPAEDDFLLLPELAKSAHQQVQESGKSSELHMLSGAMGHLEGVAGIAQHADTIQQFLAN